MDRQSYEELSSRLASFRHYPDDAVIRPPQLANLGFYSSGHGQEVTCHGCGVSHTNFQSDENIHIAHLERSPDCPLVATANALHADGSRASGINNVDNKPKYVPNSRPAGSIPRDLPNPRPTGNRPAEVDDGYDRSFLYYSLEQQREIRFDRAQPDFRLLDVEGSRLRRFTFYDWPNREEQRDYCEQLAMQGLLYTGKLNMVQCSNCSVRYKASSFEALLSCSQTKCPRCCQYLF